MHEDCPHIYQERGGGGGGVDTNIKSGGPHYREVKGHTCTELIVTPQKSATDSLRVLSSTSSEGRGWSHRMDSYHDQELLCVARGNIIRHRAFLTPLGLPAQTRCRWWVGSRGIHLMSDFSLSFFSMFVSNLSICSSS